MGTKRGTFFDDPVGYALAVEQANEVIRCQFCEKDSKRGRWKKDRCPHCKRQYDYLLAQDSETD